MLLAKPNLVAGPDTSQWSKQLVLARPTTYLFTRRAALDFSIMLVRRTSRMLCYAQWFVNAPVRQTPRIRLHT